MYTTNYIKQTLFRIILNNRIRLFKKNFLETVR